MTPRFRGLLASFAATAVLATAACSGSDSGKSSAPAAPRKAPSSSASPTPRPRAVNPLTGVGGVPATPVIAVKIDDTRPGRPQVNVDKADVVYIEAVEGGLTRLAAIFGTYTPTVGYVRSTRPSDPELLLQYGRITEAYSGGAKVSVRIRKRSGLSGWSNDARAPYYKRVNRSASPYINLTLDLAKVAKKVKTNRPKPIGWTFRRSLAGLPTSRGNSVRTVVTGSHGQGTPVEFRYDAKTRKYVRYIGGVAQRTAAGKLVTATNVVVQSCRIQTYSADRDVQGNPAQFTNTVGSGPVSVFRNGRRVNGTWSRTKAGLGTRLAATNHRRLPLNPGNTWVVLVRKGIGVHS